MTRRRSVPAAAPEAPPDAPPPDVPPPTGAPLTPESTQPATRQRLVEEAVAESPRKKPKPLSRDELDAAILRFLRRSPNEAVDLTPLAGELGVEPFRIQLAVERLHQRGMVVAPFIEPGTGGGAELTEKGLRWLIGQEGGKPKEVPVALRPAKNHVRAADEAARLPRAQVYGIKRT